MATTEQILEAIDAYAARFSAGDAAAWSTCFAEEGTHEDPVGAPVNVGRAAIQAFYESMATAMGGLAIERLSEPIVIGNEAVAVFTATAGAGASRMRMPQIIDHMTFDDDAQITALRAFWTMDTIIPDPE